MRKAVGRKAGLGLAGLVIGLVILAEAAVAAPPKIFAQDRVWIPGIERRL